MENKIKQNLNCIIRLKIVSRFQIRFTDFYFALVIILGSVRFDSETTKHKESEIKLQLDTIPKTV